MTDEPHSRKNDLIVPRIEQKLDDLIDRFDQHIIWGDKIVEDHKSRLSKLEAIVDKISWPAQAIGWLVMGGLIWLGERVFEFILHHFKQ